MKPILTILLAFLLAACESSLNKALPFGGTELTINCLFNDLQPISVMVTQSTQVQDTLPFQNLQAKIFLNEDGVRVDTLPYLSGQGVHVSKVIPKSGKIYSIEVSKSGFPDVTASSLLPNKLIFNNLTYIDSAGLDKDNNLYGQIKFNIDDSPGNSFYSLTVYYFDDLSNIYTLVAFTPFDDVLTDNQTNVLNQTYTFSDYQFQNTSHQFVLNVNPVTYKMSNNKVRFLIQINSLSPDYYYYNKTLADYKNANTNSFSSPVQVYTNIQKGLGIFAGSVMATDTIEK